MLQFPFGVELHLLLESSYGSVVEQGVQQDHYHCGDGVGDYDQLCNRLASFELLLGDLVLSVTLQEVVVN